MLVQLNIRNIVLIDRLDLELGSGLTILTGETGAGKSILLDAFALALGARGDGSLVRQGETQGQVTALFELAPGHPAVEAARAQEIETDGALILRRVQMADGRTRAFINDQPVSAQALRAIGRGLVEIHGQHDDRALVNPALHRQLLDFYGGLGGDVTRLQEVHARLRGLRREQSEEEERLRKARADAEYLRHAHAELNKLAVTDNEENHLAEQRAVMMQAEKVAGELRDAYDTVAGDHAPIPMLSSTLRRLERRETQAPALIQPVVQALDAALSALDLAGQALDTALREADYDPHELERIEERLFALRAAARKYAVATDHLPALADKFAEDLALLDAGETRLKHLAEAEAEAEADYRRLAKDLTAARRAAAARLDAAVMAELPPLKLESASFMTEIREETPGPEGMDQVEFWVKTNPGTRPGPLMKVASGGELARFMLALKVVLADRGSAPTLVFDEIDTGVGGAVADAIGQRLARLAGKVQVLAVTHAPQVAARASQHWRIAKGADAEGESIATRITVLASAARREEIARMLAGATVTAEARAAARRLIEGAA
ncbi:DNA repair protein RecN [Beijerinckia indica]|uniref:DNA repair protein RecN n=1 Tax=Beijerinckia indica subsp. indica (strain ATCC 9039 / DSM 1715 / NCIMB 8712) TaxID=395963 RepID=B2IGG8_BEII9|nr:DNA repair protein RecN [Beijerinckia indica]ACB94350.1 DNA repair protein RecN [Beijerinckia indica subsp. indica ATCC 9039]